MDAFHSTKCVESRFHWVEVLPLPRLGSLGDTTTVICINKPMTEHCCCCWSVKFGSICTEGAWCTYSSIVRYWSSFITMMLLVAKLSGNYNVHKFRNNELLFWIYRYFVYHINMYVIINEWTVLVSRTCKVFCCTIQHVKPRPINMTRLIIQTKFCCLKRSIKLFMIFFSQTSTAPLRGFLHPATR